LSGKVKEYITGKDFLDIGAFIGDSTFIYQDLIETIECEGNTKIHAVKKGIGDEKAVMEIVIQSSYSAIIKNHNINHILPTEKIEITTIDEECEDKKVGLIKMDIEGFEYFAIKGGLETIKRDKPVLLISIYHTGKDFFEIPPMIKSCVPEYIFRYLDIMPSNTIAEKILVGYIKQLSQIN
jgi:FkbM family methyltransferase